MLSLNIFEARGCQIIIFVLFSMGLLLLRRLKKYKKSSEDFYELFQECSKNTKESVTERPKPRNQLAMLVKLGFAGNNLGVLMDEAVKLVALTLEVKYAGIMEILPNRSAFLLRAGIGWEEGMVGLARLGGGNNEAGYTLKASAPVMMEDLLLETRFRVSPLLHNHQISSGVSIAIAGKEEKYGTLAVYTTNKRNFTEEEVNWLIAVSQILAAAIENHKSAARLKLLERAIDSSNNGIVITDALSANNPIIYVNSGFERITGYRESEIIGSNCNFLQKGDRNQPQLKEIKQAVAEGKECCAIVRNYRKNGTMFWNELHIAPVYNQERYLTHFIGVQTDITKRKEMESALWQKSKELETFSSNLKHLHRLNTKLYQDLATLYADYLEAGCEILQMTTGIIGEIVGESYIIRAVKSDHELLTSEIDFVLADVCCGKVFQEKKTITYIDGNILNHPLAHKTYIGTPIWVNGEMFGILNFSEPEERNSDFTSHEIEIIELMAQSIGRFIAAEQTEKEREEVKEALRESQERLDSILSSLEDIVWSALPANSQFIYLNRAVEKISGRPVSQFFEQPGLWEEIVDSEDREKVEQASRLLSEKGINKDVEYRILRPDGEVRWLRDRAHLIYDANNTAIRIDGIAMDITERKLAAEKISKSEEQFRLTFELAPIGMAIISLDGKIEQINQALCDSLGYSAKELLGRKFTDFISNTEDKAVNAVLRNKLLIGEISHFKRETCYRAKDGTNVHTILQVSVLRDAQGQPLHILKQVVDISDRKRIEEQLLHDAVHDGLTGLPNRLLFIDRIEQAINRSKRSKNYLFAVLFLDLDDFKLVNESKNMGLLIGDALLMAIAHKLQTCIRPGDTVARLGGDEFAILLDDIESEDEAIELAQKINLELKSPFQLSLQPIFTSASIGITFSSIGYEKGEDVLRDADVTMYRAKQAGKSRYAIFDSMMHDKILRRLQIETDLRRAIEASEFVCYYQPLISLKTNKLIGFEALIRWQHPREGLISPGEFIPIAEETGLIVPIGEWILREACQQLQTWQQKSSQILTVSVNLSSRQLQEADLLEKIDQILGETKLNPKYLKLEITESILMENIEAATQLFSQIKERGIKLSLDDFGTGYSSLSYLHRFPIDTLKVDRSFVKRMGAKGENNEIVRAIVTLAHNLGMDVIAEGIETKEQLMQLKQLGCDVGQGYLLAKPLAQKAAENLIDNYNVATRKSSRSRNYRLK
ncbi:MAG: EAL domain-containing protein [Gomphosphaeria aponina SAG 52.96 = DSM 107014]|uniref:EAL domain-containing protein n=1 Tax=Gomphosphaeria aponina SAG 52.96 = DSM 107014 TaxID=1521640 RepID=A0A941GRM1_9CHRO|nr:EAL domain-containing protein [Gomphosphaeria aponina SAG 52.96 = DSM 107014]